MLRVRRDGEYVNQKFKFALEDCPSVIIGKMMLNNVQLEVSLFFVEEHCLNRKKVSIFCISHCFISCFL